VISSRAAIDKTFGKKLSKTITRPAAVGGRAALWLDHFHGLAGATRKRQQNTGEQNYAIAAPTDFHLCRLISTYS
jgi:hypothetical protein